MKKSKKLISAVVAMLMMFSFASCGDSESDTTSKSKLGALVAAYTEQDENKEKGDVTTDEANSLSTTETTTEKEVKPVEQNEEKAQQVFEYTANADGKLTITKVKNQQDIVNIPNTIDGKPVVAIGDFAFCDGNKTDDGFISSDNNIIKKVVIPDGVTSIGENAFYGCVLLESINIPESVTTIGEWAFGGCRNLKSVKIPSGIKDIEACLFYNCISLEETNIPEGVTNISGLAYSNCINLKSITIPESVYCLGNAIFDNCTSLTSVKIPNTLEIIQGNPFPQCKNLKTISVEKNNPYYCMVDGILYTKKMDRVIACENHVTSVTILETVKRIENGAFEGSAIKSITIPRSVSEIGEFAFCNCKSLTSIQVDSENANFCVIDGAMYTRGKKVRIAPAVR